MSQERVERGRLYLKQILGYSKLEVSVHAADRMHDREIRLETVLEVLRNPSKKGLKTKPNRKRVRKNIGYGKAIDVIYEEREDRIIVITVYKVDV